MNRSRKFAEERGHALDYRLFALKKKKNKGEKDDEYSLGRRRIVYNCVYLSSVILFGVYFSDPIRNEREKGSANFVSTIRVKWSGIVEDDPPERIR